MSVANVSYGLSYNPSQQRLDVGSFLTINGSTSTISAANLTLSGTDVASKIQSAYDEANTKVSSTGGIISGDLSISGNLTVTGNVTTVNANNLIVQDNMIYLNDGDENSNVDLGIAGNYNDGTYKHAGLFRDASDGVWKFYDGYLPEPDAAVDIDTNDVSFTIATVQANLKSDVVFIRGYDPIEHTNSAYTLANTVGSYANSAYNQANTGTTLAQSAFDKANSSVTIYDETISADTYYPLITNVTTGSISVANTSSSKLSFVPDTGTLTVVDLNTTSDAQFKKNIQPIDSAISILNSINGVSFNWKDSNNKSYGVIAQELQKILPELVKQGDNGLSVSYIPLIAILIESVKEQQKQIEELKSRV